MDITHPQEVDQNLEECLRHITAVGMMFYGNCHTTDPDKWLDEFRSHDYRILLVILYANKELCFERCNSDRGRPSINKQRDCIYKYHDDFYQRECENPFHKAANVEEIKIETANMSPVETAKDVLERF